MHKIVAYFCVLLLLLTIGVASSHGQSYDKTVVMEGFSNVGGVGCPFMTAMIEDLMHTPGYDRDRLLYIKFSLGWPISSDPHFEANESENLGRESYYKNGGFFFGIPVLMVDGEMAGSEGSPPNPSALQAIVDDRLEEEMPYALAVAPDFTNLTVPTTITLHSYDNVDLSNHTLLAIMVEEEINYEEPPGNQGETDFYWVMLDVETVTDDIGVIVAGVPMLFNTTLVKPDASFPIDDPVVIVLVQNNVTKEIRQGGSNLHDPLPPPPPPGNHVLLSEVCTWPDQLEFIELYNPGPDDVDLSDYYLTDATFSPTGQFYWRIVEPGPAAHTVGGGVDYDFHARFPTGFTIAADDSISIAVTGNEWFLGFYGIQPDLELFEDGTGYDNIPDMVPVFLTETGSSIVDDTEPQLGNVSESLVLYYWDGTTDLVTDVDVFFWGDDAAHRFSKTGVAIDGPDAGYEPSQYAAETQIALQIPFWESHFGLESYTRVDFGEGLESDQDSNGMGGHDELSEDFPSTWAVQAANPGTHIISAVTDGALPQIHLGPNYPNPFNPRTTIDFAVDRAQRVSIVIHDISGRRIATLTDRQYDAGRHQVEWRGCDDSNRSVASGTYLVRMTSAAGSETRKVTLAK